MAKNRLAPDGGGFDPSGRGGGTPIGAILKEYLAAAVVAAAVVVGAEVVAGAVVAGGLDVVGAGAEVVGGAAAVVEAGGADVVVAGAGVWLQETMLMISARTTRRLRMTENLFITLTS